MSKQTPILAVCGKGGVGKTAFSALLARILMERHTKPLLLIDADPAGGLVSAIGEGSTTTLADVRERLTASARRANDTRKAELAHQLDYMVMEAHLERDDYALLAMEGDRIVGVLRLTDVFAALFHAMKNYQVARNGNTGKTDEKHGEQGERGDG